MLIAVLAALLAYPALAAVLNTRARLREGPSRSHPLVAWLEADTSVDVLGESSGWYQVLLGDGRRGWVWGAHLDDIADAAASRGGAAEPRTLQDDLRALREDIVRLAGEDGSLRRRKDIDRLGRRIDELAETQRELTALLEASTPSVATPMDGTAVAAGAFLTVGAVLGWIAARLTHGRRERRGRIRV